MSTGIETYLELYADVESAFYEDKECEHSFHAEGTQVYTHRGKAKWYVRTKCPTCGRVGNLLAFCDTFVRGIEQGWKIRCSTGCGVTSRGWTFALKERIEQ